MNKTIVEFFGWYGVVAILVAYGLNVFNIMDSVNPVFLWLNLTGSAGIVAVSWLKRTFQPMLLNIVWLIITAIGPVQLLT